MRGIPVSLSAKSGNKPQLLVVTDHAFKHLEHERRVAEELGVEFRAYDCTTELETIAAIKDADVVITNFAPFTRNVISTMKPNTAIIRYGIGFDNVDIAAANDYGVSVVNVTDYGVETVADHAAAGILSLTRRLPTYTNLINENGWARPGDVGKLPSLRDLTVGLIGFGRIARALLERLRPFGVSFVVFDPILDPKVIQQLGARPVTLDELAEVSNIVSLHAPSTPATRGLVNKVFLDKLPFGAIVVNTSRGNLINTDDLIEALNSGQVAGAALDVTDPEPLPKESTLHEMPQVILTPHAAFFDERSLDSLQLLASAEAARFLRGEAVINLVNQPIQLDKEIASGS